MPPPAPQTPINTRYRALYNFKRIYTHRYICVFLCLAYCFAIRLWATPIALRAIRLRCYAIAPLPGQYAPRFGYLPAANTPHKSIHSAHIPKSINTSQFPTEMFAFSDLFSQNRCGKDDPAVGSVKFTCSDDATSEIAIDCVATDSGVVAKQEYIRECECDKETGMCKDSE